MSSAGIIIHLGPGSKDRVFVKLENLGENWEMLTLKSSQKFWEKNGKFWGGNFSENVVKFIGKKLRACKNLVGPGHPRASAHLWFQSINQSSLRLLITPLKKTPRGLQEHEYKHKKDMLTLVTAIVTRLKKSILICT